MSDLLADVSNTNGLAAGCAAIADPRVIAVYAKGTEATGFRDQLWPEFRAEAAKLGKPIGCYVFLHPDVDGAAQARYLLAYTKPAAGDLEPVVDTETLHNGDYAQCAQTTLACLAELRRQGYEPLGYASSSLLQQLVTYAPALKSYRWWYADYASKLWTVPGVRGVLWQFTDAFGVGRFRVDGDRLLVRDVNALRIPRRRTPVVPTKTSPPVEVRGPKGGLVARRPLAAVQKLLPKLLKRFGSIRIARRQP